MSGEELKQLRAQIDSLDEQLIGILGQRFIATGRVGVIKATQHLDAVDALREAQQAERYTRLAVQHGLPDELVQRVFRAVIDEVVANHKAINDAHQTPDAP